MTDYAVLLSTGDTVFRFDEDDADGPPVPGVGEAFDDIEPIERRPGADEFFSWQTRSIHISRTKASARLAPMVRAELERRQGVALMIAGTRIDTLARRTQEVEAWYALGGVSATISQLLAAFNALPLAQRQRRFRFALASAAVRGEPNPAAAIARFEKADDAALTKIARWEAIADKLIEDMKALGTPEEKQAVFDAANWGA